MKRKAARPKHPPIQCSAPGCKRTSTWWEPGTRFICGKCWRRAPQHMRAAYTKWRRKLTAAERRGDDRAINAYGFQVGRAWERVFALLCEEPEGEDLPPLMVEELRRVALI